MFNPAPLVLDGPFNATQQYGRRPVVTDHSGKNVTKQVKAYLEPFELQSYAVEQIERIVEELALNHASYNLKEYDRQSRITAVPSADGKMVMVHSKGVIGEDYFREYEARVAFTHQLNSDQLNEIMKQMLQFHAMPNLGPHSLSKGRSLGTIQMAQYADEKLSLEKGQAVAPGFHEFTFTCPYRLYYPIRPDILSRLSVPFPA